MHEPSPELNFLGKNIVECAFAVHQELGAGLLETVYEQCLAYELEIRGIPFERQVALPVRYKTLRFKVGFRLDLLVAGLVVIEIKAVEHVLPVHESQILTYLKLSGHHLGLLINFNTPLIKNGIRRFVFTS